MRLKIRARFMGPFLKLDFLAENVTQKTSKITKFRSWTPISERTVQLVTVYVLTRIKSLTGRGVRSLLFAAQIERFSSSILLIVIITIRFRFLKDLLKNGYDPAITILLNTLTVKDEFSAKISAVWVLFKLVSPVFGVMGVVFNVILIVVMERIKKSALFSGKFDTQMYDDLSAEYQDGYVTKLEDLENARRDYVEYSKCLENRPRETRI